MNFLLKNRFLKTVLTSSVLAAGFFLSGCSSKTGGKSFMAQLDTVDALIKTGQVSEAFKALKDAEGSAFSAFARLGIYKRFAVLGEDSEAERVIKDAYKNLPDNDEICTVYSRLLLRKGDTEGALKISERLSGGKYGSLHSEAVLKLSSSDRAANKDFLNGSFVSVYYDAYERTKDSSWLKNTALIFLSAGNYTQAADLQEDYSFKDDDEAFFWAKVQFDAGRYDVCIRNLQTVKSDTFKSKAWPLMADSYYFLDDEASSENCRQNLITLARKNPETGVPSSILVNSSIYQRKTDKFNESYDCLMTVIHNNPYYIPALVTYSRFAYEDSLAQPLTELEKAVRQTGLRTLRMREYDERPKFLVSDALAKLKDALDQQHKKIVLRYDILLVEMLQLDFKTETDLTVKGRNARVWNALEENCLGKNLYPPYLMQFALHELIGCDLIEEARALFTDYIDAKYHLEVQDFTPHTDQGTDVFGADRLPPQVEVPEAVVRAAFGDRAAGAVHRIDVWECEFAAYFTLRDKNGTAARRLYEYAVYESSGAGTNISNDVSLSSVINLAMLYSSSGDKEKALELYGLASGRAKDALTKSVILYRMAVIQNYLGRDRDALLSLDYSIALDKSNADARLLKRMIEN